MYFLWRKNNNDKTGELIIVLTEQDRAQRLISGPQWQCINEPINAFNKDPEVKNLYVTAAYAGDLKDEKINDFLVKMQVEQAKLNNKQKVLPNGNQSENNDTAEDDSEEECKPLHEVLENYPLVCPKCGSVGKALLDKDGNVLPCKSCLCIDAYLKGKKDGLTQGFDAGVARTMSEMDKVFKKCDEEIAEEVVNKKKSKFKFKKDTSDEQSNK